MTNINFKLFDKYAIIQLAAINQTMYVILPGSFTLCNIDTPFRQCDHRLRDTCARVTQFAVETKYAWSLSPRHGTG